MTTSYSGSYPIETRSGEIERLHVQTQLAGNYGGHVEQVRDELRLRSGAPLDRGQSAQHLRAVIDVPQQ